jgi:hypothetical protein
MADDQHNQSRPDGANHQQAEAPRARESSTEGKAFSVGEVASLVDYIEEEGDKVYALLAGIHAMLPRDQSGEFEAPSIANLVGIAQDLVGDVSFLSHYKDRIKELKGVEALLAKSA